MKQNVQDERFQALRAWLNDALVMPIKQLSPLPGDASFRRYFRVYCGSQTYVVMDAPPAIESCDSFIAIAKAFHQLGLNVPIVHLEDKKCGFLLLTDFGDRLYVDALNENTVEDLYQRAFNDLLLIQACQKIEGYQLPRFTPELYYREMSLFRDWYLERRLKIRLSAGESAALENIFQLLIEVALSQPQVCVHRDYHSRNLMVVNNYSQPGLLDFQDAVFGPVTYDLISLLRDCYIDWPPERIETWVFRYHQQACEAGMDVLKETNKKQFLRWFDWIGLQRHLKCIGLFSRLNECDQKPMYLQYIPRIIRYTERVCERYPEFEALKPLLKKRIKH